jgi:hypothetical protein
MARGRNCYDCEHYSYELKKCEKTDRRIDNSFEGQLVAKNCEYYET